MLLPFFFFQQRARGIRTPVIHNHDSLHDIFFYQRTQSQQCLLKILSAVIDRNNQCHLMHTKESRLLPVMIRQGTVPANTATRLHTNRAV